MENCSAAYSGAYMREPYCFMVKVFERAAAVVGALEYHE